jgi:hypothetical protein
MTTEELPTITWTWEDTPYRPDQHIGPPPGVDQQACQRAILPLVGPRATVWIERMRDGRVAVKEVHPHRRPGIRAEVEAALKGLGLQIT